MEQNMALEDYIRDVVYHLHLGSVGSADFHKNSNIFGEIHAMARSPHFAENKEFLKSRGLSYTDFLTANDNILNEKINSPMQTIDVSKIEMPKLDAIKELFVEWYPSQSTSIQRKIEECNLWHRKIINAHNRGEKDLTNWPYLERSY